MGNERPFFVFDCPTPKALTEAFLLLKPVHLVVGTSINEASYVAVRVQTIVAPSEANPGRFVFTGTTRKSGSAQSVVRWQIDYETKRPCAPLEWLSNEPVLEDIRKRESA
jgi:hypothetical protein